MLSGTNNKILEVGSWKGASARVLSKYGTVVCVDDWSGDGSKNMNEEANHNDIYSEFRNNLKDIWYKITPYKITSKEAISLFEDNTFDLIYIDGNHNYDNVKHDISEWYKKVKIGGILCGHDFDKDHDGVISALLAVHGKEGNKYHNVKNTRIWYLVK